MRRPPARRPRVLAGALIAVAGTAATACADDGPADTAGPRVVAVAAQPCDRPLPAEGVGVVVGDGTVVTAGHLVEGPRRTITVDGAPATVVVVDPRTDLALLRTELPGDAELADGPAGALHVATPAGDVDVALARTGLLVVDDTTDRARYEREVHTVRPDVTGGTSGAPLVDDAGRVLGVVVLANRRAGTSYAVTAAEVRRLLRNRSPDRGVPDASAAGACPD